MPEIVVKIINDDGTEHSFGPMLIAKSAARDIARVLDPVEAKRRESLEADRVAEIEADQEKRSKEAAFLNQRRIASTQKDSK